MIQVVPAITGLIDRLESAGMVTRARCTEDRRVVYIEITDKALRTLAKMDQPLNDMHRALLGHLTRAELKELIHTLEKARSGLE